MWQLLVLPFLAITDIGVYWQLRSHTHKYINRVVGLLYHSMANKHISWSIEFFLTLEATLDGVPFSVEGKKEIVKPGRYI